MAATSYEVGKQLIELCRQQKFMEAIEKWYSPAVVSVEAMAMPGHPARLEGMEAVKGKSQWWVDNHEIHSFEADGPYPHGDRVIIRYRIDVTSKAGPMAGQRMQMDEAALYTIKDGKVVHEEFFYHMG